MIPLFIPYVNRRDLLDKAVRSSHGGRVETIVINNSDRPVIEHTAIAPPVPLTFAQTQNWMLKMAWEEPFYLFMHSDAEAVGDTVLRLVAMAQALTVQKRKWGVIFTAYDALAAFNTEAFQSVGGWDPFLEWYHADTDMYRRLRLAGYEMVESNLPVKHEPSSTLNADPAIKMKVNLMFPCRVAYYRAKWGGDAGSETFDVPFNGKGA